QKEVDIAKYPFATIDPNVGVVKVPDERLDKLASFFHSKEKIPAVVEFVDIAGLVEGAHKGEGLGNKFLSHIREVAAVCHVVRDFEDSTVAHVAGAGEPLRDLEIVETELLLKDLEVVERRLETIEKEVRANRKGAREEAGMLQGLRTLLGNRRPAREFLKENQEGGTFLQELKLLSSKPVLLVVNTTKENVTAELAGLLAPRGVPIIPLNAKEELEAGALSQGERAELGVETKLPRLIQGAYELLSLITFFTAGEKETRAWTIKNGATAPEAGGVIHSDFQEKFIRASVISWEKLLEAAAHLQDGRATLTGSERGVYQEATSKGWLRTEGKEYVVQDGDVIEILHAP
ncbi:MAG: redox-regulated ATPase YchF, partial [Patescibacteria group bacterium]